MAADHYSDLRRQLELKVYLWLPAALSQRLLSTKSGHSSQTAFNRRQSALQLSNRTPVMAGDVFEIEAMQRKAGSHGRLLCLSDFEADKQPKLS